MHENVQQLETLKHLDSVLRSSKELNIHLRHEYAPIIPKCGIVLWRKDVPWHVTPHVVIPSLIQSHNHPKENRIHDCIL